MVLKKIAPKKNLFMGLGTTIVAHDGQQSSMMNEKLV